MRFAITLMAILPVVSAAQSATINVPADQPTIQAAINAASSGDTIAVAPGVYAGPITIPCAKLGITLSGAGKAATFIDVASGGTDAPALSIGTGNCGAQTGPTLVEGFCFRNTGDAARAIGIRGSATAAQHGLIRNNRFEGFTDGGIGFPDYQFEYWDIDNNEFDGARLAIWVNDARHISITNNQFSNFVVAVGSDFCDGTYDVTIAGNTMDCGTYVPTPNNYYGIYFGGKAHDWTITDNVLSNFTWGIYVGNCGSGNDLSNMVIENNSIAGPTQLGLQASTPYGINNLSPVALDATNNWWGVANGPFHGTSNPGGTGTAVTDNVNFTPWLTSWPPPIMVDDDGMASVGSCDANDTAHNTIGAAVAAASPGDTIYICPGVYAENVTLDKRLVLVGAGNGTDPAVDTIITPPSGNGILISTSGDSPSARLIVKDLRVTGAASGINIAAANASHLTFDSVACVSNTAQGINVNVPTSAASLADLDLTDCDLSSNGGTGLRFPTYAGIDGLTITGGHMDGNAYGWQIYTTATSPLVTNVTVTGTTFNNNTSKGMYLENLDHASFSNIQVRNSGTAGAWAAGIDLNLKYKSFQNILFIDTLVTNCGAGDAINGAGITVKARDDGSYSSVPASLDNVQIVCSLIAGCQEGIRWGEPGKSNLGPTNAVFQNCTITGSVLKAVRNESQSLVDARNNWWGTTDGSVIAAQIGGSVDYDPWLSAPPACSGANLLYLEPTTASVYIKPSETAVIDLNVANLAQQVTGLQAMLNFSSTYFKAGTGDVNVAAGGGDWDQLIYDVWNAGGDLDVAVGVHLSQANPGAGTQSDATTAVITLTPTGAEGITRMVFRSDAVPDPGLVASTYLSGVDNQPVWPLKLDSANMVIDGTAPTISVTSAVQGATNVLDGANTVVQGAVTIQIEASDALAGLAAAPTLALTNGAATVNLTTTDTAAPFSYTWTVDSSTPNGQWDISASVADRAGNTAADTDNYLELNKNQITGQIELESFVGTSRNVTFVATGGATKIWTLPLSFSGGVATYVLTDVPADTTGLSAKTAWSLRNKLPCGPDGNGQAVINFTGDEKLLGGDFNATNSINVLDYSIMKASWGPGLAADVNGDGFTGTIDYGIMKANWFKVGDEQ
ncbi:MAG: hypothetical protein AMXMBFR13_03740 [Phycisphaerae bacterium]